MTIEEAERLLQRAYNIDVGLEKGELTLGKVDVMDLHKAFYDGGLFKIQEVQNLLRKGGMMRGLIEWMINIRVGRGEYIEATLRKMYFEG